MTNRELEGLYLNNSLNISQLSALKADKTQGAWIAPTLVNSWTVFGVDTVGYMKDTLGFVHLKGAITGGAYPSIAFTLPEGYRPGNTNNRIPIVSNGAFGRITITTDGSVQMSVGNSWAAFDGISFRAGV